VRPSISAASHHLPSDRQHCYLYLCKKTYQFTISVKDDNYDACKTANVKIMTPVKPQISKFEAEKIAPSGLYRVMEALLMSVC
jgi:hypothetical protein